VLSRLQILIVAVALSAIACLDGETPGEGEGEGEGQGSLNASPLTCAIGEISLGASGFCAVVLVNDGAADLELAEATIADATEAGVFSASDFETVIAPGGSSTLRIAAEPTTAGFSSATVEIRASGADEVLAAVSVSVVGVPPPTCVAGVKSINGVDVGSEVPQIAPLDDVVLTLSASTVAPGRTIASYQWMLLAHPAGSTVALTSESTVETRFTFDDSFGLDTAGPYTVRASIVDSTGLLDDCEITLAAVPSSPLYAQLTWSAPQSDIDLHMYRASDDLCSSLDCYALTCADGGVSWGDPSQSPQLVAVDDSGFGPETIIIEAPADGAYRIAVHARTAPQPTSATLKLFSDGGLLQEQFVTVPVDGLWYALDVTCAGGVCTAEEDGSIEALEACAP
jgi:hypothetical protein